jgi:hypothetical protein
MGTGRVTRADKASVHTAVARGELVEAIAAVEIAHETGDARRDAVARVLATEGNSTPCSRSSSVDVVEAAPVSIPGASTIAMNSNRRHEHPASCIPSNAEPLEFANARPFDDFGDRASLSLVEGKEPVGD